MEIVILVINLPRSTDRKERMMKRLEYYGLEAIFVPAIDKSSRLVDWYMLSQDKIPRWKESTRAETACYLSHLKAIRTGIQEFPEVGYYLILEDDALFRDDFFKMIPYWLSHNLDIICLSGQNFKQNLAKNTMTSGLSWYHREEWGTWSAIGYFISRQYAQQSLLDFDRPFRYLPYPRLVSETIHRYAPRAVYTDESFLLEDGYNSTLRGREELLNHRKWFESKYDYRRFLDAEKISYEEFKKLRRDIVTKEERFMLRQDKIRRYRARHQAP
jgi:GR25 family glycosyltransferase involved in LPS biosynthesis